jgi:hypothetical protein
LEPQNERVDCPFCGARTHGSKFCPECGKPIGAQNRLAPRGGPAEIRLYRSNLAVLATCGQSFQWRLADIDVVRFEPGSHEVALESGEECLTVSGLARRTEEFARRVREAIGGVLAKGGQALHVAFPFLNPDQLQSAADVLREGRSASVAKLTSIHPRIPTALAANAVDLELRPYYQELLKRTAEGLLYAGFKLIRPEEKIDDQAEKAEESQTENADQREARAGAPENGTSVEVDADGEGPDTLYWFFFPLAAKAGAAEPANVVAWEASSRSGRATYFFRLVETSQASHLCDPQEAGVLVDGAVRKLNRVLAMLNFRRRPIYLSDDELEMNPRYHRYAIACRRITELQEMRRNFLGRAIHSSPEAWQAQLASILARAGA